ncbi:MAG: signal peptidase I, partial [Candidatus Eisenbacteria bacterium]|nr:signal peptidase I [Candidatus Eisenbacteria bacterium]
GDIVIFKHTDGNVDLIKRCVAIEGQVVEMRNKELIVDGRVQEEPYTQHIDNSYIPRRDDFGPLRIPEDHIFVLGDNRDRSNDSRFLGPIPLGSVVAKARIIYFSFDTKRWLPRIGRIGTLL